MTYTYFCKKCEEVFELGFPFSKNPERVPCPDCKEQCGIYFGSMTFLLKGGGWPGKTHSLNREMTARNEAAGRRMKGTWGEKGPVRTVAHDYGNGDVREVRD